MDDAEAVARCLAGETVAFEEIVNRYQPKLLAFAWTVLGNKEEARDAVQDVFVQAYLHLSRYDPAKSFKNWIYSIAYHWCLNKKKREKFFRTYLQTFSRKEPPFHGTSRSGPTEGVEDLARLFRKLSEKERLALSLNVNEGYTAAEIGEIIGCSESTARVHLFRAKKKLRRFSERTGDV